MTHLLEMYDPSRFVQPHELSGDATVTIDRIVREEVTSELGKSNWPIVYFSDWPKPLRLGRKMGKQLIRMFKTADVNALTGKRITLYATTERIGGESEEVVRIRKNAPPQVAPKPTQRAAKSVPERITSFTTALKATKTAEDAGAVWQKGATLLAEMDEQARTDATLEYEAHLDVLREGTPR